MSTPAPELEMKGFSLNKLQKRRLEKKKASERMKLSTMQKIKLSMSESVTTGVKMAIPKTSIPERLYESRAFGIGFFFFMLTLITYVSTLLSQYSNQRNKKFISEDRYAGECFEIVKPFSGVFAVDVNGNWETATGFDQSTALYNIDFSAAFMNSTQYALTMSLFRDAINSQKDKQANNNMAQFFIAIAGLYAKANSSLAKDPGFRQSVLSQIPPGLQPCLLKDTTDPCYNDLCPKGTEITLGAYSSPTNMFNGVMDFYVQNLVGRNASDIMHCALLLPKVTNVAGKVSVAYDDTPRGVNDAHPYVTNECTKILNPVFPFLFRHFNPPLLSHIGGVTMTTNKGPLSANITFKAIPAVNLVYQFDLTSVITAVSINTGQLDYANCVQQSVSKLLGYPPNLIALVCPKYPNMDPILCTNTSEPALGMTNSTLQYPNLAANGYMLRPMPMCFVSLNTDSRLSTLALPAMSAFPSNPSAGTFDIGPYVECTCPLGKVHVNMSDPTASGLVKSRNVALYGTVANQIQDGCKQANFVFTLVGKSARYDVQDPKEFKADVVKSLTQYVVNALKEPLPAGSASWKTPYELFMRKAFALNGVNAMLWSSYVNATIPLSKVASFMQPTVDQAWSFVNNDPQAFAMTTQFYGKSDTIAPNSVSFGETICGTSIFLSDAAWTNVVNTPPVPLVESYYSCISNKTEAFVQSAGVATGLSSTILAVLGLVLMPLLMYVLQKYGYIHEYVGVDAVYNDDDKKAATDEFALQLLRIRDGDMRGIHEGGELQRLTEELLQTSLRTAQLNKMQDAERHSEAPAVGAKTLSRRASALKFTQAGTPAAMVHNDEDDDDIVVVADPSAEGTVTRDSAPDNAAPFTVNPMRKLPAQQTEL